MSIYLDGTDLRSRAEAAEKHNEIMQNSVREAACRVEDLAKRLAEAEARAEKAEMELDAAVEHVERLCEWRVLADRLGEAISDYLSALARPDDSVSIGELRSLGAESMRAAIAAWRKARGGEKG